jgi:hypothetical protein
MAGTVSTSMELVIVCHRDFARKQGDDGIRDNNKKPWEVLKRSGSGFIHTSA